MTRTAIVLCMALVYAACGSGLTAGSSKDMASAEEAVEAGEPTVSGFIVDPELIAALYAMSPNIDATDLIEQACVHDNPVFALYADGTQTETVMSDSMCNFTLHTKPNVSIHMVAGQAGATLQTYNQDVVVVGTASVTSVVVSALVSNSDASTAGVAAFEMSGVDDLVAAGLVFVDAVPSTNPPYVPRSSSITLTSVTPASFTVLAMQDTTTMPPTFTASLTSSAGVFAIFDTTNPTKTQIVVTPDSGSGATAGSCDVLPGYVTVCPLR